MTLAARLVIAATERGRIGTIDSPIKDIASYDRLKHGSWCLPTCAGFDDLKRSAAFCASSLLSTASRSLPDGCSIGLSSPPSCRAESRAGLRAHWPSSRQRWLVRSFSRPTHPTGTPGGRARSARPCVRSSSSSAVFRSSRSRAVGGWIRWRCTAP